MWAREKQGYKLQGNGKGPGKRYWSHTNSSCSSTLKKKKKSPVKKTRGRSK